MPGRGGTSDSEGAPRRRKKLLARITLALSARRTFPLPSDAGSGGTGGMSEVLDGEMPAAGGLGICSGLAVSVGMLLRVFRSGSDRDTVITGGSPLTARRFACVLSFSRIIGMSRVGFGSMPVTYLMNVDIARKQNLPGVVNANRIGSVCAQSAWDGFRMQSLEASKNAPS